MPRYQASIESSRSAADAFAYLAAFDNIRDWDPSVASARRLDEGELRIGSTFEGVVRLGTRTLPLRYEIGRLEPGKLVAVEAQSRWFRSYDVITIEPRGEGSHVRYDALIALKKIAKIAAPIVGRALGKIGADAAGGVRRVLNPA